MDVTRDLDFVRSVVVDTINGTEIRHSELHGFGLFCSERTIKCDTQLCKLDGQVLSIDKYDEIENLIAEKISSYKNYFFMECNYLSDGKLLVRSLRTKYSYINHSRMPNVTLKNDPLRIVTTRDIEVGDEICIDYREEPLPKAYVNNPVKDFL
jgi:SET domain-containing protein|tara:strand:+ start:463 stop:921 length:459 start_codon:yes stop_codon:yes gene_type:complete